VPGITTIELLDRTSKGYYDRITLKGLQNGSFCMMLECSDGCFIHQNRDGSLKEYPKVDHALAWLKRKTNLEQVTVDISLWHMDSLGRNINQSSGATSRILNGDQRRIMRHDE